MLRGVRGATTVSADDREQIILATTELLTKMVEVNQIGTEDIASVLLTMTDDLHSVFPAAAARAMGWTEVPLTCARELEVDGALGHCIRVLLHWNTNRTQAQIRHVYLRDAVTLRPDLAGGRE
ncbi:MAG: chorismate mutase [Bacillota bacterium]